MYVTRKGQALQFNWLFEKEAFILRPDDTFSIDFDKVKPSSFCFFEQLLYGTKLSLFLFGRLREQLKAFVEKY